MAMSSISTPYFPFSIKTEPQQIHDVDPMSCFEDDITITELGPQHLIKRIKQEPREYTQLGCGATYNTLTPLATTLTVSETHPLTEHIKQEPTQPEYTQEPEYTQLGNYNPLPSLPSPHPSPHNTDHILMAPADQSMPLEEKPKPKPKPKKIKREEIEGSEVNESTSSKKKVKQEKITDSFKIRKKVDRFGGVPEEEIFKRTLPDHLAPDLDIIIIGINPGLFAAYKGHHYAGPGNHFWKCLFLAGLIPEPMTAMDDFKLIKYGIGFTNIVGRTTRGSSELKRYNRKLWALLTRLEIKEGAKVLLDKIQKYKPKIVAFNGKGIYEVFCGHKKFEIGKQPDPIPGTNTVVFVMPSSSARCAQLPRAVDKVPFYVALKKLRDFLCGVTSHLNDSEVTFPDLKIALKSEDDLETEFVKNEILDGVSKPESAPLKNPKKTKKKVKQIQKTIDTNFANIPIKQEKLSNYEIVNSQPINMQSYQNNASGNQYNDQMYNYSPQPNSYSYSSTQGIANAPTGWSHNLPSFQNQVSHQPLPVFNHYDPGNFTDQIPSIGSYKNQQTQSSNSFQSSSTVPTLPLKSASPNSDGYNVIKIKEEHGDESYTAYEQEHLQYDKPELMLL